MFDYFCDIYADYLPQGIKEKLDEKSGAIEQLEYLFTECNKTEQKIYLFIDEYDPVSYTHLDVYKRQVKCFSRKISFRKNDSLRIGGRSVRLKHSTPS